MAKLTHKDWKKKHYPVTARRCGKSKEIDHGILKWSGLYASVLKRHGLEVDYEGNLTVNEDIVFHVNCDTCASCQFHVCTIEHECPGCLIAQARGGIRCDRSMPNEVSPPWHAWQDDHNPRPMLRWLRAAKQIERHKAKTAKKT